MRRNRSRCLRQMAFFAPTVEVCLRPVGWPDATSFRPSFHVHSSILRDMTPSMSAAWMERDDPDEQASEAISIGGGRPPLRQQ